MYILHRFAQPATRQRGSDRLVCHFSCLGSSVTSPVCWEVEEHISMVALGCFQILDFTTFARFYRPQTVDLMTVEAL